MLLKGEEAFGIIVERVKTNGSCSIEAESKEQAVSIRSSFYSYRRARQLRDPELSNIKIRISNTTITFSLAPIVQVVRRTLTAGEAVNS